MVLPDSVDLFDMLRRLVFGLSAFVAATAVMLAVSSPAQAYDNPMHKMYTDDSNSGGVVYFWPDGDIVRVCDIDTDGYRAIVNVYDQTADKVKYTIQAAGGEDDCTQVRGSTAAKYDLAEGHCFQFHIYIYDADHGDVAGDDWAYWRNYNTSAPTNC